MPVTNAQIDAAVPVAGTPDRTLTNTALKGLVTDIANAVLGIGTPSVLDFASLPAAAGASGQFYWVRTSTGVWLVNRKVKGLYYSNGATWDYVGDFAQTADQIGFTPAAGIVATNTQAAIEEVVSDTGTLLAAKADLAGPAFTGTVSGITKAMVGLGSVDNTTDANKPVSTAQQTALDLKADTGAATASGLTMATARLLGRSTASTGAVEEITLGTGLSFTGTTLNASGGGGGGSVVNGSELLTSGTTYTTPSDITTATRFKIIIVGAGGGGAGCAATTNLKVPGGGGGGVGVVYITGLSPSTSYTIAIGAAGAGGAAGANPGAAGGNTSITIGGTAYTGNGGSGATSGAFAQGAAGGATANIPAAPSFSITGQTGGAAGSAAGSSVSGHGGSPGMGLGVGAGNRTDNAAGLDGTGYGAGGSGASTGSATARAGGNGTQGCILLEWVGS